MGTVVIRGEASPHRGVRAQPTLPFVFWLGCASGRHRTLIRTRSNEGMICTRSNNRI